MWYVYCDNESMWILGRGEKRWVFERTCAGHEVMFWVNKGYLVCNKRIE